MISVGLLVVGLLIKPWALVLVLLIGFGGPLLGRIDAVKGSSLSRLGSGQWATLALGLAVVVLALNKGGGQGALILALIPVAWVLITDRPLLQSQGTSQRNLRLAASPSDEESDEELPDDSKLGDETDTEPTSVGEPVAPLTGSALLAKIKELGDAGKSDLVRACGYAGTRPDGTQRLNFTAFYEALLEAKGIDTSGTTSDDDDDDDESSSDDSSSRHQAMNLPADWNELDGSEIVKRLKSATDVSVDVLSALAASDDWEVRRAVAWHENTPDSVVESLADDDDSDVRQAIGDRALPRDWRFLSQEEKVAELQGSEIALEVIEALASSENWELRQAVAWSPSTTESVLARLKDDDDDDVKYAATAERQLPINWRFCSSWDKVERLGGETVDVEILKILAKSRASDVKRAVALNEGAPERLLAALIEDHDSNVQSAVRERDLPETWKSMDDEDRVSALRDEGVSETVLAILARSGNWTVRQAVALSASTPNSILEILSRDEDADVTSGVRERDLPDDWKYLDEDEKVERLKNGGIELNVLAICAKSGRSIVREAVAKSPETPSDILVQLSEDNDSDVEAAAKKTLKKRQSHRSEGDHSSTTESLPFADPEKGFVIFASPLQVCDDESGLNEDAVESLKEHALKFVTLVSECSGCWGSEYITDQSEKCSRPFFVIDPKGDCLFSLVSSRGVSEADKAQIHSSAEAAVNSPSVGRNGRIYACVAFAYDHGDSLIEFEDFNREESEEGDEFENIPTIARSMGENVEVYLRLPEADGDVDTVYYGSWDADGDLDETDELGSEPDASLLKSVLYGSPFTGVSNQSEREMSDGDEDHNIYIKTEPGGRIAFCKLDSGLTRQLQESIATQELNTELEEEMRDNSYGAMNECDGVVNSGDEGDSGNEGTIVFSEDQPHLGPSLKDDGETFEDGVYAVLMRLSKCSIEFEFTAKGGFDEDEFEEISVPVRLPEEIVHGLYGHPDFNIISGFRFRGEPVEEYEGEVEDRGYDDQLTFFAVKDGETTVLYSNYNGEEEWCDEDQTKALLSSFL